MITAEKTNPILIIDDEIQILKLLAKSLMKDGYSVEFADDGEKGIDKIKSNKYSLVFTDLKMPGISGKEVLKYIRNIQNKLTPVVGMSGTPWLLQQNDFDAVLVKPFSIKEFLRVTRQFAA
ncbi:MAG: response regulator [Rhodospirillaceae bacterium]|nr:response regulator [Rhodospirillaceae bacterium]